MPSLGKPAISCSAARPKQSYDSTRTVTDAVPIEIPVARLSFAGWANYLKTYRTSLVQFAAEMHQLEVGDVNHRLDRLIEVLELFEIVEVTERVERESHGGHAQVANGVSLQATAK